MLTPRHFASIVFESLAPLSPEKEGVIDTGDFAHFACVSPRRATTPALLYLIPPVLLFSRRRDIEVSMRTEWEP